MSNDTQVVPDDSDGLHLLGLALHSQGKLLSDVPENIDESEGECRSCRLHPRSVGSIALQRTRRMSNNFLESSLWLRRSCRFSCTYGRSRATTRGRGCGREVPGRVWRMLRVRGICNISIAPYENCRFWIFILVEPNSIHTCEVLVPVVGKLRPRDIELYFRPVHLRPLRC